MTAVGLRLVCAIPTLICIVCASACAMAPTLILVLVSDFVRAILPLFVPSYGQCGVRMGGCGGAQARHHGGWMVCCASLMLPWRHMRWPGVAGGTCGHRGWCDSDGVWGLTCIFPPLFLSVFFLSFLPPILTSLLSSSSLVLGLAHGMRQPVGC